MVLALQVRPFAFPLLQPLRTSSGLLQERRGWLLRLEAELGRIGWGEVAPLEAADLDCCRLFPHNARLRPVIPTTPARFEP